RHNSQRLRRLRLLVLACAPAIFLPAVAAGPSPRGRRPGIGVLPRGSCGGAPKTRGLGGVGLFERRGAELGDQLGETVAIECRSANRRYEGFQPAAAELVRLHVNVIVASSHPASQAAGLATHTIPIVAVADWLFGRNFASPHYNITGVLDFSIDLTDKRLELLKEMIPTLAIVGVLSNPNGHYRAFEAHTRRAADELGIAA